MARKIKSRYKIKSTLITQSPIHVGGVGVNADTDMALAVNGEGKFYIPATSIAGALKAWMEAINPQVTNQLWGYQNQNSDDIGHASFIIVEDAPISSSVIMEIRDGVAIDRFLGTAVNGMKYDRAILPKYTKIPLQLTLEREYKDKPTDSKLSDDEWEEKQEQKWQESQQLFAQLINALKESDIYLGGAKSRGLGKVKLYDEKISEENLLTSSGIMQILRQQSNSIDWSGLYTSGQNLQNKLNITIKWNPISSVMVKSEGDGIAIDILPLVSQVDNNLSFVIPGSSIKGVWRSQAERIIRTVFDKPLDYDEDKPRDNFQDHIKRKFVKTLFGAMAELDDDDKQLGVLSSLYFQDCYANLAIDDDKWEKVVNATEDKNLRDALDDIGLESSEQVYHVAIDRWTGGASEGALYTVLEPKGFSWQPIEISLDLNRLKSQLKYNSSSSTDEDKKQVNDEDLERQIQQHLALFLLVLRDFIASKIPIGFGTNRGMGAIEIKEMQLDYRGNDNELKQLFTNEKIKIDRNIKFQEYFNTDSLQAIESAWQKFHQHQP